MLRAVDIALRELFQRRMRLLGPPGAVREEQIGIAPPDSKWDPGKSSPLKALNVCLADMRENRGLRSNERLPATQGTSRVLEPAPVRVDCHYLISAWSPSKDLKTKTLDEHELLAEALEVLVDEQVITVGGIELPTEVVPAGGFPKLAEFWGTMGEGRSWRPAIYLILTIPVRARAAVSGAPVTTRVIEYRQNGDPASTETRLQIGGHVRNAAGAGVPDAWVRLEDPAGHPVQATRSGPDGTFDFLRVVPGTYQLRARSTLHPEALSPPIAVPAPDGRYDVAFP